MNNIYKILIFCFVINTMMKTSQTPENKSQTKLHESIVANIYIPQMDPENTGFYTPSMSPEGSDTYVQHHGCRPDESFDVFSPKRTQELIDRLNSRP